MADPSASAGMDMLAHFAGGRSASGKRVWTTSSSKPTGVIDIP
ncbi:hypothetical protein MMALV_07260 [Candidatus Methanomethylophilus alvi Mx1201]|uniref:Uncharacterized protein n=1 Tax=Methanomethylophilus alvi (strain Mx1201) TaxID=1236689 RepID=M9SCI7_METAX|nr:hypothetical protein MMALV_07260 [Candidatus Methanomethylophilus alvi Mx1201]